MDTQGSPLDHVALFLVSTGGAGKLLADHVDDGSGRCSVCSAGGQTGHVRFPCSIAWAARRAQRAADRAAR